MPEAAPVGKAPAATQDKESEHEHHQPAGTTDYPTKFKTETERNSPVEATARISQLQ